jgi:hypothetical protein
MNAIAIVEKIRDRRLREVTGDTPEATVAAYIYSSIQREGEVFGDNYSFP